MLKLTLEIRGNSHAEIEDSLSAWLHREYMKQTKVYQRTEFNKLASHHDVVSHGVLEEA